MVDGTLIKYLFGTLNKDNKMAAKRAWSFDPSEVQVHVVGAHSWEQQMFRRHGFRIIHEIAKADIVVWTGGEDINPILYGEKPLKYVKGVNNRRDAFEVEQFRKAEGKFKVGICRGGQLLNVLNGGTLWQHVVGHGATHHMMDLKTNEVVLTSSVHHQSFRPAPTAEIVATCAISNFKESEFLIWDVKQNGAKDDKKAIDYEVVFYPESRSLCFQGHPEYAEPMQCEPYFFSLIDRYFPVRAAAPAVEAEPRCG